VNHEHLSTAYKIGVFGSDGDICNSSARDVAYDTGKLLARAGAIVVTGGGPGVMEAASKGAIDAGGITIGILPGDRFNHSNPYCTIKIPTGIGFARCQIITNTCHGAILIHGGIGTQAEAGAMYYLRRPVVAIRTTGGTAAEYAGKTLDSRNLEAILCADTAEEAVKLVLEEVARRNVQ